MYFKKKKAYLFYMLGLAPRIRLLKINILNDNTWIRWNVGDPTINLLGQMMWQSCAC